MEGNTMSEENKKKLNEQLVKCVLDEKIPSQVKFKKMDYIIRLTNRVIIGEFMIM